MASVEILKPDDRERQVGDEDRRCEQDYHHRNKVPKYTRLFGGRSGPIRAGRETQKNENKTKTRQSQRP
jgi:hypothetical protein